MGTNPVFFTTFSKNRKPYVVNNPGVDLGLVINVITISTPATNVFDLYLNRIVIICREYANIILAEIVWTATFP